MTSGSYGGGGPLAVGVASALLIVATILLILRVYNSFQLAKQKHWDMVWVFVAYLLGVIAQVFLVLSTRYGIGNHIADVDPTHLGKGFLYVWIFNISTILSTGFGKLAIVDFLLQIMGPTTKPLRWLLYVIGISTMILNVNQSILVWFQCTPRRKLWNPLMPGKCKPQRLILTFGLVQGSWSALCDFILAFCPAVIFWKLQISWLKRFAFIVAFAGGSVAGAAAAIKTSHILSLLAASDVTNAILPLILWAETEMWLIIIMGTIPTLPSLFAKLYYSGSPIMDFRSSKGRGVLQGGGDDSKGIHSRSRELASMNRNTYDRKPQNYVKSSESEEDILFKEDGIMVQRDYEVNYAEQPNTSVEETYHASSQETAQNTV